MPAQGRPHPLWLPPPLLIGEKGFGHSSYVSSFPRTGPMCVMHAACGHTYLRRNPQGPNCPSCSRPPSPRLLLLLHGPGRVGGLFLLLRRRPAGRLHTTGSRSSRGGGATAAEDTTGIELMVLLPLMAAVPCLAACGLNEHGCRRLDHRVQSFGLDQIRFDCLLPPIDPSCLVSLRSSSALDTRSPPFFDLRTQKPHRLDLTLASLSACLSMRHKCWHIMAVAAVVCLIRCFLPS